MTRHRHWIAVLVVVAGMRVLPGLAQQVTVSTPQIGVRDRFYEHINIGWGYHRSGPGGSWFIGWGGPMSAIPPFGGYDAANDFRFGFARNGNGSGFHFNLAASQGSSRTITMDAPSVTMMNGARGQVFSGSLRPFVTGLIPVVGDYPVMVPYAPYAAYPVQASPPVIVSPLAERLERLRSEPPGVRGELERDKGLVLGGEDEPLRTAAPAASSSSAARGDLSLAVIRRQLAAEDEVNRGKLEALIDDAQAAEQAGNLGAARSFYLQAAAKAPDKQRAALLNHVEKLKPQP